jgi:hypothetical protein
MTGSLADPAIRLNYSGISLGRPENGQQLVISWLQV